MIPKVIHYCWFGRGPLPKLAKRCIQSWEKFLPEYQIKQWNEDNFDINCCQYVAEAYREKKYAFVSDFVRFHVLYEEGGIYFDTDVEVIKSFDSILGNGAFMGCENSVAKGETLRVAPGLGIGAEPGLPFFKEMIDMYKGQSFYKEDGSMNLITIVSYTSNNLRTHGLIDKDIIQTICGITIYPKDYFCPMDNRTHKIVITPKTVSIHYYAGSWIDDSPNITFRKWLLRTFGESFYNGVRRIKLLVFPKPWEWK